MEQGNLTDSDALKFWKGQSGIKGWEKFQGKHSETNFQTTHSNCVFCFAVSGITTPAAWCPPPSPRPRRPPPLPGRRLRPHCRTEAAAAAPWTPASSLCPPTTSRPRSPWRTWARTRAGTTAAHPPTPAPPVSGCTSSMVSLTDPTEHSDIWIPRNLSIYFYELHKIRWSKNIGAQKLCRVGWERKITKKCTPARVESNNTVPAAAYLL